MEFRRFIVWAVSPPLHGRLTIVEKKLIIGMVIVSVSTQAHDTYINGIVEEKRD